MYDTFTIYMYLGHKPKQTMSDTTSFTLAGLRNEVCKIIHGKTVAIQRQI